MQKLLCATCEYGTRPLREFFAQTMALGALDALKEAGERKIVVGFDGIPEVLNAIRGKSIAATVELPARQMGARAIEDADQFINTRKVPKPGKQLIDCTLYPRN